VVRWGWSSTAWPDGLTTSVSCWVILFGGKSKGWPGGTDVPLERVSSELRFDGVFPLAPELLKFGDKPWHRKSFQRPPR
jgi:hypothetical protein